jgi:hypothetical protein
MHNAGHVFERICTHLDGANGRLDADAHDGAHHSVGVVRDKVGGAKAHTRPTRRGNRMADVTWALSFIRRWGEFR